MEDLRIITRKLNEVNSKLDQILKTEYPINEKDAADFLGISVRTLQNQCHTTYAGTYIINRAGKRMYYKSKLIGANLT